MQTKLAVGEPGDAHEQEADRIADEASRHPVERGAPTRIQRFVGHSIGDAETAPVSVQQALSGSGQRLAPALRQDMESRFGSDFSGVRLHTGRAAEQSARDLNASAYTVGLDIVFAGDRFAPGTSDGRRLLAHELTHVVQQAGAVGPRVQRQGGSTTKKRGVFRIEGTAGFIASVEKDLDDLQSTSNGARLIQAITAQMTGRVYTGYTLIEELSACSFTSKDAGLWSTAGVITYNPTSCFPNNRCPHLGDPNWNNVPTPVGLFHELVHAYLYYVTGQGTHDDRECMATGLGPYYTNILFNENRLRCELGLPIRPCYDENCDKYSAPVCAPAPRAPGFGMTPE